ncbi:MAG: choline/carnitine O-acyltransferase [Chloroflexota bacterium]
MTSHGRDRSAPSEITTGRSHINALFKGLSFMKDNAMYQLAFGGPATVLAGYNMLLQLAGAEPDDYLPDGAWQFYVEFGLREDAARHQSETVGFQRVAAHRSMSEVDKLSAWMLASMWLIRDYEQWLELLWEESALLQAIETYTGLTGVHRDWQKTRPFAAPDIHTSLVDYRKETFVKFWKYHLSQVSQEQWRFFSSNWFTPDKQEEIGRRKRAFVRQLSINRYIEPGEYSDERHPIDPGSRRIAVVYRNNYYLVDFLDPGTPDALQTIRQQATAILNSKAEPLAEIDTLLVTTPRQHQLKLRATLSRDQRAELEQLRKAIIILNHDSVERNQPLTYIRSNRRGIGDHAITLFQTGGSTVFDFSHIFFDGPAAMAVAEMMTNEALKYAQLLALTPAADAAPAAVQPVDLTMTNRFNQTASRIPQYINYVSAEQSEAIEPLQQLRRSLKTRTRLRLTINDLLVLYRTIFNTYYQPSQQVRRALDGLRSERRGAVLVRNVETMFKKQAESNPSLLIPIDASRYDPRERLFPSLFRSPLPSFDREHNQLVALRQQATRRRAFGSNRRAVEDFERERQNYLGYLEAYIAVMRKYREIATSGESMGATAIRLIAGLPNKGLQKLADEIPGHLSIVNDAIKGEEVFSNVGRVTAGSSIARFASAKDDNNKKVLVWGVMTNDVNELYITLRDFREPILDIVREGHLEAAQLITQDFLDSYMRGLYRFAGEMQDIIATSRKS